MLAVAVIVALLGAEPAPVRKLAKNDPLYDVIDGPGMERYKKILFENEHKQLWKQIHWLTPAEAQTAAKENRKPVLLMFSTGSGGKANAAFT